jgi:peptide/nickel transport system permease protein
MLPPRVRFLIGRAMQVVPTLLLIAVANFVLLHLAPGDAADVLAGESGAATKEYVDGLRAKFRLDQPLVVQLVVYVKNIVSLDLGYSFRQDSPVAALIGARLGPTLLLMGTALVLAVVLGVSTGIAAARKRNGWFDNIASIVSLTSYSTPMFWAGLMLIVLFSVTLGWLPTSGMETIAAFYTGWNRVFDIGQHLILPALTLSLFYMALFMRLTRAAMLEQAGMDYVTTARAKGLTERQITFRHVIRNAMLPVVTMIGVQAGSLVGGSVIVETVFGWPGLGLLAFDSLFSRDLNLLLSIFFISACLVVVVNLVVDVVYTLIDPRIKLN